MDTVYEDLYKPYLVIKAVDVGPTRGICQKGLGVVWLLPLILITVC